MPKKSKAKFMLGGAFPLDLNGVHPLPQTINKPLINQFYEERGITNELVYDILSDKFYTVLDALCKGDQETILQNTEKYFGEELVKQLPKIKKSGLKFDPSRGDEVKTFSKEDPTDYGALRKNFISDIPVSYIQDTILVKGVSSDRDKNGVNSNFQVAKGNEPEGIRQYVHKYFTGNQFFYQH